MVQPNVGDFSLGIFYQVILGYINLAIKARPHLCLGEVGVTVFNS